jgi:hypothetical protein
MADPDISSLKSLIAADAPQLAALLDGPNAPVAVGALGKALLGDAQASLADVAAAAKQADKLQISAAEQEAQLRLRQSDGRSLADLAAAIQAKAALDKVSADDRANARARQIALHDQTNMGLVYGVTALFFILILLLILAPLLKLDIEDGGLKDLLFTLLGVVATGWANIIGYYFGSSAGSAQKSQTINAALLEGTQDGS